MGALERGGARVLAQPLMMIFPDMFHFPPLLTFDHLYQVLHHHMIASADCVEHIVMAS